METAVSQRRRGRWIPGIIALAVLLAIGVVFGAGADLTHPSPHSLSGTDVANDIAYSMQAQQSAATHPQVTCPSREPVRAGFTFYCSAATTGSDVVPVKVVELDGRGHLRWTPQSRSR